MMIAPQLVEGKDTTLKDYRVKSYIRLSKDLPHSESGPWKLVCTMPYNCLCQPSIELDAPAGQEIRYNFTNPLVLFLTPTETFKTSGGAQSHEAQNWVSGEGTIYTIPAGVTVKAVKYRETGFNTAFAGSFECDDSDYNLLWKKAARTAYLCMRDHFYDCPDRERVGFWGDGTPELITSLIRLAIGVVAISQPSRAAEPAAGLTDTWKAAELPIYCDPDDDLAKDPSVIKLGEIFYLYYTSANPWQDGGAGGRGRAADRLRHLAGWDQVDLSGSGHSRRQAQRMG